MDASLPRSIVPCARAALLGGLLALPPLAGCAVNPATGERQFSLIGESQEIAMGRDYDQQIVAELGLYPDPELQRYVQELGGRLAAASERPNLPWTFRVVDDPVVNAFALPGGFIYVTRGILAHMNSEAELASVLGHEIGHVTARHSVGRMSTQQLAQVGLAVGVALEPGLQGYAGLASAGLGLLFLKYGRDDERQADDLGLRYMSGANFDPREMAGVFEMLSRVGQAAGGGGPPEWLSTHPNPENRRERIDQQVAALGHSFTGTTVNREPYLRRLDGLVYGDDPRQGYFEENRFYHPEMKFRFTFPAGWKTANQSQAVLAASPQGDAAVQITVAQESSPDAAARSFFGQEGIAGEPAAARINGLRAAGGAFAATTQDGRLRGRVAFIAHGAAVYRVLAYAAEANWSGHAAAATGAIESFAPLTDASKLAARPHRVRIVELPRAMTLDAFLSQYPSAAPAEAIALLNDVAGGARLAAGSLVKRVTTDAVP